MNWKPKSRWVWGVVSYGIAAACLFWVLHDIDFRKLFHSIAGIDWWWAGVAILLQLLTYLAVAWEWQLLLRPIGSLSLVRTAQATFAGRFANDVLPVQLGYVLRSFLAGRWMQTGLATVMPSLAVERLLDGFWLACGIGLITVFVPLPTALLRARDILAVVVLGGAGLTGFIIVRERKGAPGPFFGTLFRCQAVRKVIEFIREMADGLRKIGHSHLLPAVLSLSVLKLVVQGVSFYMLMWAYGFRFSVWVGLAVFLISYLGISVPSTPASAGVFQVFSIEGLRIFGIERTAATGYSLVAFALFTLVLSSVGFVALAQSGVTLRQVRREVGKT